VELQRRGRQYFFAKRYGVGGRRARGNLASVLAGLTLVVIGVGAPVAPASATTRAQASSVMSLNSQGGSGVTPRDGSGSSSGVMLTIAVVSFSVEVGSPISPTVTIDSGLASTDTATITGTSFTYAGTGTTVYPKSTTPPTAIGTYSVNPSKATVTISPSSDAANYSTNYAYIAGPLTITPDVVVVVPTPRATRVIGDAIVGERRVLTIVGSYFSASPSVTSNAPGAIVRVGYKNANRIQVSVTVHNGSRSGAHLFTITTSTGKRCRIGYVTRYWHG